MFGVIVPLVLLTGCGIGGVWLDPGNAPSRLSFPFLSHWIKEDMTRESRRGDSWACGALPTIYAADHGMVTEGRDQGSETDIRLSKQWVLCMKSKGYIYLEKCAAHCLYP